MSERPLEQETSPSSAGARQSIEGEQVGDLHTDVLVIGSGPAGAAAALFLASYGVDHIMITKYRWTANTPRAHITNQRTVEIMRDRMQQSIAGRVDDTPDAALQRARLREALELKDYEFNAHGVELGQRYASRAVVSDGTPEPADERDPELYYHPTTWPGARLPHCWLGQDGQRVSTHDLAGKGAFCLLTGITGQSWAEAASKIAEEFGIELNAHVIGPGREYTDLYDDWSRLREVAEDGCVLVRPDTHVAWRSAHRAADPTGELRAALAQLLDRADLGSG